MKKRAFRYGMLSLASLVVFVVVFALLPTIVANTHLRNLVINRIIANPQVQVTADGASCGWTTPLQLDQVQIVDSDDALQVHVNQLLARKPWLQLWSDVPDLGTIEIDRPHAEVHLSESLEFPLFRNSAATGRGVIFSAHVNNASLNVHAPRLAEPVINLDQVDLKIRVVRTEQGRLLVVDPMRVLDHHTLTPQMCDRGLQLVAPILANAVHVNGQMSFELLKFRLPLDANDESKRVGQVEIEGVVKLHHVTAALKDPLLQQLTRLIAQLLNRDVPAMLRIADDSEVHFRLRQGRVYHDGLAFVFPEVSQDLVLESSGSVGLDETLDLTVEVPVPLNLLLDGLGARGGSGSSMKLHVTGTIDQPIIAPPEDFDWLTDLANDLLSAELKEVEQPLAGALFDLFGELLDEPRGRQNQPFAPWTDRMHQRNRVDRDRSQTPGSRLKNDGSGGGRRIIQRQRTGG